MRPSDEDDSTPPPRKRRRVSVSSSGSDDEFLNGDAYMKWKNKSKDARSKAAKSGRKAKAIAAANDPRPSSKNAGKTGVGVRAVRKKRIKEAIYGDSDDEDDALMEWTMPDYLQRRREVFDKRMEKLKEGGLSLPILYNDVDFSDEEPERFRSLPEKPQIPLRKDAAKYEDIELPYSAGVIPAPIAQHLRPYQVDGAAFLHEAFVYQKGVILGDDMGLGKTIQVIAFLTAAYGKTGDARDKKRMRKKKDAGKPYYRTLIICPGSLMANWEDELNRWGWWHSSIFHGSKVEKAEKLRAAEAGRIEIMITTYDTYRMAADKINMIKWDCVIADECHKIKERKAEITKAQVQVNALCRIGLTGTAIQNKYEELWTLLNWTNPGRLGPVSQWKTAVCNPLKLGQSHDASQYQLAQARKVALMLVNNLLPQFFKRRTKSLIKDQLPKKTDRVVFCPMSETQADAYQNFLESEVVQLIKNSSLPCLCDSKKKQGYCCKMYLEDGSSWKEWVFPAIMILQKISNHLATLIPQASDTAEKQSKDENMLQIAMPNEWKKLMANRDSLIHSANPEYCGKWRVLQKLLKFWHDEGGNKVLVFSHSVRLLKMLQRLFINTSYNVKYLDGSIDYEERFLTVQEFNTDPTQFVFLISTKAGGVGLNITSANKVVVVDPNWNPSYDLQAQDRAYRIGQTRDVEVFRLVSQGTLEEIVYARQIYKQQQANIGYTASSERRYFQGVQGEISQKGEIFGLSNLFAWHNEHIVLRDIVNKTNVAESRAGLRILDIEADEAAAAGVIKSDPDSDDGDSDAKNVPAIKAESDHEDAAMSQLVAEIAGDSDLPVRRTGKGKARNSKHNSFNTAAPAAHDPILAILASGGVTYTHENSEVVGPSEVESKLSAAAMAQSHSQYKERVFEATADTQTQPTPQTSPAKNVYTPSREAAAALGKNRGRAIYAEDGNVRYRYKPPQAVKERQFGMMAGYAGHVDEDGELDLEGFALRVGGWTMKERTDFLRQFYTWRKDVIEAADAAAAAEAEALEASRPAGVLYGEREVKWEPADINAEGKGAIKIEATDDEDEEL
ncbi:Switch 2 [Cyphellophora attinorum]|uniref:Switch 2 n=1 Tax=Cyphellophora attinorum TaxID=1664694 RepID=A0A0N1H5C7_9EURO|nr:Switch 2 [Phialophora attinorum]KPI37553.1 Switch 2 [Phialophora attinorum]